MRATVYEVRRHPLLRGILAGLMFIVLGGFVLGLLITGGWPLAAFLAPFAVWGYLRGRS